MSKAACSIDGCSRDAYGFGLCKMHYARRRRHGDPLKGASKSGQPMAHMLAAMNDECPKWPFAKMKNGYAVIRIDGQTKLVSRVVCEIVNGPAPSRRHEAAHLCGKGDEGCFGARCLVWKTPQENNADKITHGTHLRGDRVAGSRLTPDDVLCIRILLATGKTQKSIAEKFGVRRQTVSDIACGRNWGWMRGEPAPIDLRNLEKAS